MCGRVSRRYPEYSGPRVVVRLGTVLRDGGVRVFVYWAGWRRHRRHRGCWSFYTVVGILMKCGGGVCRGSGHGWENGNGEDVCGDHAGCDDGGDDAGVSVSFLPSDWRLARHRLRRRMGQDYLLRSWIRLHPGHLGVGGRV